MEELNKLIKSSGFKWLGSITSVLLIGYLGSMVYKNYIEIKKNTLQGKLASLQILEYKEKYSGIMEDLGANTHITVKEGSQINQIQQ